MEKLNHIEDEAMDTLLQRYLRRQEGSEAICKEFDLETTTLYIERVLTDRESARFETHLSSCSPCRQTVVALTRLAQNEDQLAATATMGVKEARAGNQVFPLQPTWLDRLRSLLLPLATPRFALAAVALIALAVSVPILLSKRNQSPVDQPVAQAPQPPDTSLVTPSTPAPGAGVSPVANPASENTAQAKDKPNSTTAEAEVATGQPNQFAVVAKEAAPETTPPASKVAADTSGTLSSTQVAASQEKKEDAASRTAGADEQKRIDAVSAAPPPPPQTVASESKKLERIDPEAAKRLPEADKDAGRSTTIKQGISDGTITAGANKPEPTVIRPRDTIAQPPAPSPERAKNKAITGPGSHSYRENRESNERASNLRKINKKTFFLINDTWTDKDYKRDKELPVITLVKDSDVYKEVVSKRADLLKFFLSFAANERAIIVYKNTVYKLIPQDSDK